MLLLEAIQKMKKAVSKSPDTLAELLEQAAHVSFTHKDIILRSFQAMKITQMGNVVHLEYDKRKMFHMKWNAYLKQARGLVIDFALEEVVLYPFDKFFELDEESGSRLRDVQKAYNTKSLIAEITEKIDGSLISTRFFRENLHIASSGTLMGDHVHLASSILEKDVELSRFIQHHPEYTVILEMRNTTFPQLVRYEEDSLTVIGMRNMKTLHLLSNSEISFLAKQYDIRITPTFSLTLEEMLDIMNNPKSTHMEGYILKLGSLMVKMKVKNFLLASRFGKDPARNFNMLIEAFNEGRVEAISQLIHPEYQASFDMANILFSRYINQKQNFYENLFSKLDSTIEKSIFGHLVTSQFPDHKEELMEMKEGKSLLLSKKDAKKLKHYAEYLSVITHFTYAEQTGVSVSEVEDKIASGNIQFLKSFFSVKEKKTIYLIHKWQFVKINQVMFTF